MDGSVGMGRMVDWSELLINLRRHGWGTARVAEAINLAPKTVSSWMERGCEPRFSSGLMLIRLHDQVVMRVPQQTRFAVQVEIRR